MPSNLFERTGIAGNCPPVGIASNKEWLRDFRSVPAPGRQLMARAVLHWKPFVVSTWKRDLVYRIIRKI